MSENLTIISSHDLSKKLAKEPEDVRYSTGMNGIDLLTDGFGPGELVIITGFSGHGKTSFCQTLTVNMSKSELNCLWFSFEMTAKQFLRKFNLPLPLFYLPEVNNAISIGFIENAVNNAIKKYKIKAVFIDHLHYIVDMIPAGNMSQSMIIGDVCRKLKQMAISMNITVFLIAHTTQPRSDDPPNLGSIRDSSFIAQESDAVYCISRIKKKGYSSEVYSNDSWFYILKQRRTGNMGKKVRLAYNNNIFTETITGFDEHKLVT